MNNTRNLIFGVIFMVFGISGFIIASVNMKQDPTWLIACVVSIMTTVSGITILDNVVKED